MLKEKGMQRQRHQLLALVALQRHRTHPEARHERTCEALRAANALGRPREAPNAAPLDPCKPPRIGGPPLLGWLWLGGPHLSHPAAQRCSRAGCAGNVTPALRPRDGVEGRGVSEAHQLAHGRRSHVPGRGGARGGEPSLDRG